ncbi:MAG: hypothetical protein JJ878_07085 [Alphaproteobacteria bacterium]|nr:hypothetical protein [Alphaproteobacteria bacterium]MBO6862386.1 hypothetical protein [Alphaproteobacteria bacterium]
MEVLLAVIALQITIVCGLKLFRPIERYLNGRIIAALDYIIRIRKSNFMQSIALQSFFPTVVLIGLIILNFFIPSHDFALFSPPNLHALLSGVRDVAAVIYGIWSLPLVALLALGSLLKYFASIVRWAARLADNNILVALGVLLGIAAVTEVASDAEAVPVALVFAAQITVIAILVAKKLVTEQDFIDYSLIYSSIKMVLLEVRGLSITIIQIIYVLISTFVVVMSYLNIFVFDRDIVEWQQGLSCRIDISGTLQIEDVLIGEDAKDNWVFTIGHITPFANDIIVPESPLIIVAVRTSGYARHAGIFLKIDAQDGEETVTLAEHNSGGYFLGRGQFVVHFYISELTEKWNPNLRNPVLNLGVYPQQGLRVTKDELKELQEMISVKLEVEKVTAEEEGLPKLSIRIGKPVVNRCAF